jgi:hypothetical protein
VIFPAIDQVSGAIGFAPPNYATLAQAASIIAENHQLPHKNENFSFSSWGLRMRPDPDNSHDWIDPKTVSPANTPENNDSILKLALTTLEL